MTGEVKIARWNHICFSTQGASRNFYHNKALVSVTANARQFTIPKNAMIGLGLESHFEESFSGLVADVQFFPRALTEAEMKQVENLEKISDAIPIGNYANGLTNTTYYDTDYTFPYSKRDDYYEPPIAFSLEACRFLNDRDEHAITFPKINVNCKKAKEVCETFGGTLPKLQFGNHVDISTINPELKTTWVSDSMDKTAPCQKATKDASEDKFVVKPGNEAATNFMCIIQKDKIFKFKQSKDLKHDFVLVNPDEFEFVSLKGDLKLTIDSDNGASALDYYFGKDFTAEEIKDPISLMGRKQWTIYDFVEHTLVPQVILFSVCDENEFTCSMGLCMPLNVTCNFEKSCPDGSDEEYCGTASKPGVFYDYRLSPAEGKNAIAPLSMKMFLDRVIKLDMEDNIMTLSLTMIVTWRDPRLVFKNLLPNGEPTLINKTVAQTIWHPRILLPTAATDSKETFYLDSEQGRVDAIATADGQMDTVGSYECKIFI